MKRKTENSNNRCLLMCAQARAKLLPLSFLIAKKVFKVLPGFSSHDTKGFRVHIVHVFVRLSPFYRHINCHANELFILCLMARLRLMSNPIYRHSAPVPREKHFFVLIECKPRKAEQVGACCGGRRFSRKINWTVRRRESLEKELFELFKDSEWEISRKYRNEL